MTTQEYVAATLAEATRLGYGAIEDAVWAEVYEAQDAGETPESLANRLVIDSRFRAAVGIADRRNGC